MAVREKQRDKKVGEPRDGRDHERDRNYAMDACQPLSLNVLRHLESYDL